jgi:hypothetical protein
VQGPTTLGLMYAAFPCISVRGCFHDLNPWPHGHKATVLLLRQGSPSLAMACSITSHMEPFLSHGLLYNIPYGFTLEEDLFVDAIPYYQIDPHKYKDKKVVR